ncbi:hypothetical protein [Mesorhizobium sp. B2-4-18]|uniref:hypothetical protein n=1 Tax=Mesorhizobium sp. B2-4-18 TaxID=2589931 RepID=UPI001FEEAB7D|nr:hypothetical protein [Mesorhizobium sp. B2-4-18]
MRLARDGIITLGGAGQPDRFETIAVEYDHEAAGQSAVMISLNFRLTWRRVVPYRIGLTCGKMAAAWNFEYRRTAR